MLPFPPLPLQTTQFFVVVLSSVVLFFKNFESHLSKSLHFLKFSQTKIPHYPRRFHPSSSCPSPTHFLLVLDTLNAEKYNIH